MLHCDHRGGSKKASQPCCKKIGATVITDECPKNLIFSPYVEALHEKKSIEFNRKWINKKIDEKCTIYDIDPKGSTQKVNST